MAISRRPEKYSRKRGKRPGRPGAPPGAFVLTVVDGPTSGREYYFEQPEATIGRVEGCEIVLVGQGISRQHARVRHDQGVHLVEDLKSANGTRLNGERIGEEPEVLRDGDYVTLAEYTLQFSLLDAVKGDVTAERRLDGEALKGIDATQERTEGGRRRRRLLKIALVVACVAVAGAAAYKLVPRRTINTIFDRSNTPLRYSESDEFFNAVFGYCKYDQLHRERVRIRFTYFGGRATVEYGAWGVDKVGEVAVLLNDEKVGQAPVTLEHWTYGVKVDLPLDKLKKGENELVFDNTRNPPGDDRWGICYLQIQQEALPPPDLAEARHRFELASKAWEEREVEPGNLYEAMVGFKRARNYMERLDPHPPLYQEAVDFMAKIDKELTKRFDEALFSSRRAEKVDEDPEKARRVLTRSLRYFRKGDFRHRKIKDYLDALAPTLED